MHYIFLPKQSKTKTKQETELFTVLSSDGLSFPFKTLQYIQKHKDYWLGSANIPDACGHRDNPQSSTYSASGTQPAGTQSRYRSFSVLYAEAYLFASAAEVTSWIVRQFYTLALEGLSSVHQCLSKKKKKKKINTLRGIQIPR